MLSLTSIAGWEEAILASITGARGGVDERDRQIERSGLYGEYPAVVRAYEELFADAASSGEALKRALFLVWRSANAAPWDSGIAPLPDGTMRTVIDELCVRARRGETDDELEWMLAWYHAQSPSLLELYGATPALMRIIHSRRADAWRTAGIDEELMSRRGQMGSYWRSLTSGAR